MIRLLALLLVLSAPLAACGPQETDPTPDATGEPPDPADGPVELESL